jgi:ATP-binding cassette subfamily B protein RaxB
MSVLNFSWSRRLPVVLQTEVAECGVACLAMILAFHGHRVDLATLRRRYAVSLKGATLDDLTRIAGAMGLATRALRLELNELAKLRTPCILHWSLNHFVVLSRVHGKSITIHDPARGKRRISLEEASREFTGVALEAVPTKTFTRKKEPSLGFGYLLRSLGDLRGTAATIIALSVCVEVVALLLPIGSQVIVDEVVTSYDYDLLLVVAAGLVLLVLIQLALDTARSWTIAVVQTSISLHWSASLFEQLMRLPLEYFAKRHVGDVISRFGSLAIIQKALTTDVILSLFDGIMSIGMLIMLFLYAGWLAGIALASTVINALFHISVYQSYRQSTEEAIIHDARQQTHFIETLRGIASVKLLGLTDRRRVAWINHFVDALNAKFRLLRLDLVFGRADDLLTGGDRLLMLVLGAKMVMSGTMSLGMLVAFLAYRDQFATRIKSLIGTGFQLQMLSLQLTRLADIVLAEPEQGVSGVANISPTMSIKFFGEALHADNVSYRYGEYEPWVFRNISLDIPAGSSVAITGPSGCGKTTLLKILMGLTRPTEGVISCSGTNINSLSSAAYRDRIAGVLQEDGLFAGSLAENICGFDDHPDPDWMTECASRAAILDDIRQMPMGFETLVGDMGSTLSGGQKQRVILARALYRRPAILFLDEATSHLDEATEAVVAQALRDLRITRVIVAHRPATIAHADKVINLIEDLAKSTPPSVRSTAGEATRPLPMPGATRTMREASRPLGLRQQVEQSKNTRSDQAATSGDDAEKLPVLNLDAQQSGLVEQTAGSFPTPKLKVSLLASREGEESVQLLLGTSKTGGNQAGPSANGNEMPRAVNSGEEQKSGVKWGAPWNFRSPGLRILTRGARAGGQAGQPSPWETKETGESGARGPVAAAAVSRADKIQVREQAWAEGVSGRRKLKASRRKLKTSALVLSGAAMVGAVPTVLLAPRSEKMATSDGVGTPPAQPGAESAGADVVKLNGAPAPTGLATAVAPKQASDTGAPVSAPLDAAPATDFPGSKPTVTGSPVSPPLDETPIAIKAPSAEGRLEVMPEGGAPMAKLATSPAPTVTRGASEAALPALGDLGAPWNEMPAPVLSATDIAKGPFPDGVPIRPARPDETTATDSRPGTASASLAGAWASPQESNGAVKLTSSSPVAATPLTPFPDPVFVVSSPLDETPIATKVPAAGDRAEAASAGDAPVPLTKLAPPAANGESAKASLQPNVPESDVTQPALGGFNAPQDEMLSNGAPTPPVRPAEVGAADPPGTRKASAPKPGQVPPHRREASSPDAVGGTIGGFGTDRRSRPPTLRKHTKAARATKANSDLRSPLEPPGGVNVPQAPNESGQPGDPLPLSGSVPSAAIGSVEAPAPPEKISGHLTTR